MLFSSLLFIWIFFPIVFVGNHIIKDRYTNIFLLLCSLVFYAWGEPTYIVLMIFSIVLNYFSAVFISKENGRKKKAFLIVSILINLGLLGVFKYYNFVVDSINIIFNMTISERNIPLPIGISFYTFQALSYVVDVYKEKVKVQKKIINLALYISFFPQLIAGPIVQYKDINKQLEVRNITTGKIANGFCRFFCGLGKKVLLSNTMAAIADSIFTKDYGTLGITIAWLGIISYTLQIYFDFSGYSDMAIGLGKIFGFDFQENFNLPYLAVSVKDFWTRWHISLSSWFREYLYIPLGGNRRGTWLTYRNNLIVFIATGIWHGASWNFVIWGLLHGSFLILERIGLQGYLKVWPKIFRQIYTMLVVMLAWVFFRVEKFQDAIDYIKALFFPTFSKGNIWEYLSPRNILILMVAVFFCGIHKEIWLRIRNCRIKTVMQFEGIKYFACILIYILSILSLASGMYNPFIYFRF